MDPAGARNLPRIVLSLLTEIERHEARLLSWGIVDGSFTYDEVCDIARAQLDAAVDKGDPDEIPDLSADEAVDALQAHGLLFELPDTTERRFRSRMAEAVRLFFRLKQLFPQHEKNGTWQTASNLIADYRLILRPRRYPKRWIPVSTVQSRLATAQAGDDLSQQVIGALLPSNGGKPFKLAEFQVRAAERIYSQLAGAPRRGATIVCAGTGSGKTLAFYLPAMLLLARLAGPARWVRCLAVYPRNELLKDQLSSALKEVRILNGVLTNAHRACVTVGALFGAVPNNAKDERCFDRNWGQTGSGELAGRTCPYLTCPNATCEGASLVWLDADRRRGNERLRCDGCEDFIADDTFVLTRHSMIKNPPDLLFTGLEMLNQNMSSVRTRRLFGVGLDHTIRPRLVLLDEAHTYCGTYGAQAALLLRRWKRASNARPHFVGLSATLEDAARFFGELVNEPPSRVVEIAPDHNRLVEEGQEMLLALRGDPVSKTALLSASIQSAMLLRRVLDPIHTRRSLFGSKVFAFTDDLDVTNRLFHNLRDAEGWRSRWTQPSLAHYRRRTAPDRAARFNAGQSWELLEEFGHSLGDRPAVPVGRTSSQDSGVDQGAETIVATASLEVGFDDPDVGAVLQHKAPRDAASFVQRQGRAGRPRGTRPWTVVVLSDYGRDRLAYQGYDQLFSPLLKPRYLPISNRHVLRIQAVFALMDWLAERLVSVHGDTYAFLWPTLAAPPKADKYQRTSLARLERLVDEVEAILRGGARERELAKYLSQALAVGPELVEQLLWAPPRSLMLSVLPTMSRRLRREWQIATTDGQPRHEPYAFWSPLPEFVPGALFNDLNLPEVAVSLPPYGERDIERMPVLQAMREFAPGRVSRRFGVSRGDTCHWVFVSDNRPEFCPVYDFCRPEDADELGSFRHEVEGAVHVVPCLRPHRIRVQPPPDEVVSTSNARLDWATQLLPRVEAVERAVPVGSPWASIVRSVGFFAHGYGNAIEVRRFALGSRYEIRLKNGEPMLGTVRYARGTPHDPIPVALGFALDADAMRLEVELTTPLHLAVRDSPALLRALRTARFAFVIQNDPELDDIANFFQREWLVQICMSALTLEAERQPEGFSRAAYSIFEEQGLVPLEMVLDVIFQSIEDEHNASSDDRRKELALLLNNALVRDALQRAAPVLWSDPNATWESWLHARFLATFGAAVLDACQQACPELDTGELCLDINPGARGPEEGCTPPRHNEIWLSETSPGGSGIIEAVAIQYAADPRRFFHLVEAALAPSDFEEVDGELSTLIGWLAPDTPGQRSDVTEWVQAVRNARTHEETAASSQALRFGLESIGLAMAHPVVVAMHARVLRPGSSPETDGLLAAMVERWCTLEERLGAEVDARIVAYLMSADDALDVALGHANGSGSDDARRAWRYSALYSLLWPRGASVRSQALSAYNPYATLPPTDRWLVLEALPATTSQVRLESDDWHAEVRLALVNEGAAVLSAPPEHRRALRSAILRMLVHPLDTEALLVQPVLTGVTQENRRLHARFEIREGLQ